MSEGFAPWGVEAPAVLPAAFVTPQGVTIYRMASAAYATGPADDPPNTLYAPRLLGDVELSQSALDTIGIGGRVALGLAEIALFDGDRAFTGPIRFGVSDGRAVSIRVAPAIDPAASNVGTPLAATKLVFRGVVRAVREQEDRAARLAVVDIAERLAVPLQGASYAGSGGLEGDISLKDRPKPVALGRCPNMAPVFLGNVDLGAGSLPTYQSNWRAVLAHDAVRIRGAAQTAVGGTPTVGQFRDWPNVGCFQLGSAPDGPVTADVRGDAVPLYVSTTAAIVRRLAQSLGPALADAEISADAFAFADTDLPGEVGWCRGAEEISASDAVQQIVAGPGAVVAGGRAGQLRIFDPVATAAEQFALPPWWIISLRPVDLPAVLRPIPRTVAMDWRKNWTVLTDLPGSLSAADRAALANATLGPARADSAIITGRVAVQRTWRFPGLYWAESDALARAQRWRAWLEAGPRAFEITTDRYLGEIESGDIGRIAFPAYGLDLGQRVGVIGWREQLGARRLSLIVHTLPES